MKFEGIGLLLAKRRKTLEISQKELALLAGISLHTVCNLESQRGNPTLASLLAVAKVLGLELSLSIKEL